MTITKWAVPRTPYGANMLRNTKRGKILPDLHEMIGYVMKKAKK